MNVQISAGMEVGRSGSQCMTRHAPLLKALDAVKAAPFVNLRQYCLHILCGYFERSDGRVICVASCA